MCMSPTEKSSVQFFHSSSSILFLCSSFVYVCVCAWVSVLYSIGSIFSAAIFKYLLRLLLGLLGGRLFLQRFKTDWSELFPLCFRARLLAGRNPNWRWWLLLTAGRYWRWRDRLLLLLLLLLLRLALVLVVVAVSLRRTCLLLTRWPNTWYNQPYY